MSRAEHERSARLRVRLPCALQGATPARPAALSAAGWSATSATTRCATSKESSPRTAEAPTRCRRRTSCCCCPSNWSWSTIFRASSTWSSMPIRASRRLRAGAAAPAGTAVDAAPAGGGAAGSADGAVATAVRVQRSAFIAGGGARQALHLRRRHHAGGAVAAHEPAVSRVARCRCTARCAR